MIKVFQIIKIYTEKNLKGKTGTVEEVIYFVFEFFERIVVLLFHALAILIYKEGKWDI